MTSTVTNASTSAAVAVPSSSSSSSLADQCYKRPPRLVSEQPTASSNIQLVHRAAPMPMPKKAMLATLPDSKQSVIVHRSQPKKPNNNDGDSTHRVSEVVEQEVAQQPIISSKEMDGNNEAVRSPPATTDALSPAASEIPDCDRPSGSTGSSGSAPARKSGPRAISDPGDHFARQSLQSSRLAGRPNTRLRFRQQNALFNDLLLGEAERDAVHTTLTIRGTTSEQSMHPLMKTA